MLFKKSFIYTLRNWGRARGYNLKIKTRFVKNLVDNRINDYIKGNHKSKSNIVFCFLFSLALSRSVSGCSVVFITYLRCECSPKSWNEKTTNSSDRTSTLVMSVLKANCSWLQQVEIGINRPMNRLNVTVVGTLVELYWTQLLHSHIVYARIFASMRIIYFMFECVLCS